MLLLYTRESTLYILGECHTLWHLSYLHAFLNRKTSSVSRMQKCSCSRATQKIRFEVLEKNDHLFQFVVCQINKKKLSLDLLWLRPFYIWPMDFGKRPFEENNRTAPPCDTTWSRSKLDGWFSKLRVTPGVNNTFSLNRVFLWEISEISCSR